MSYLNDDVWMLNGEGAGRGGLAVAGYESSAMAGSLKLWWFKFPAPLWGAGKKAGEETFNVERSTSNIQGFTTPTMAETWGIQVNPTKSNRKIYDMRITRYSGDQRCHNIEAEHETRII